MKFLGKWVELENIILSEVTQSQKNTHGMHSFDKWILAQKLGIPKTQLTYQMMPKKKEGEDPGPGKDSVQQCRGIPGQGSGKGWIGERGEGRGLMGLSGRGGHQERGNHWQCK